MGKPKVIDVLRRFLPEYLKEKPPLSAVQRRAIWAITHCRTPTMGGHLYRCDDCREWEYQFHSCNHRNCPQCGSLQTQQWVQREMTKRINAPYFMVTFTLPCQLREIFFGKHAKESYDLFFKASSKALAEKLADGKYLKAQTSGFIGILHTWNQRLAFHPHIHYIVPAAGINQSGKVVICENKQYLMKAEQLQGCFREHLRRELQNQGIGVDPAIWRQKWSINIQTFGNGLNAIKYLGAYTSKATIGNSRIISMSKKKVTFRWKDRSQGGHTRIDTISGIEFVKRYLRHVLPKGLRSIRHYGFCHPASGKKRERIAFHSGVPLQANPTDPSEKIEDEKTGVPFCSCCGNPMERWMKVSPSYLPMASRGPPEVKATKNRR